MKRIMTILGCVFLLTGCTATKAVNSEESEGITEAEESAEPTSTPMPSATPKPSPSPTATPKAAAETSKTSEPTKSPETVSSVDSKRVVNTPAPEPEHYEEPVYTEPVQEYTEPTWEEPVYYEEPVQETQTYADGSVASTYNGQYPGTSCEGVAGLYLGGDMSYLLASYGYQVWDPVPGDVIAYFDSGWNYRHTAVFLGNGQALHGSYNADKSAQVASMYIGGYPNLCYYRVGGDTCYTQFLNDIAHANGGRAGWLEGITFPLG